jgi:hypothetical protein
MEAHGQKCRRVVVPGLLFAGVLLLVYSHSKPGALLNPHAADVATARTDCVDRGWGAVAKAIGERRRQVPPWLILYGDSNMRFLMQNDGAWRQYAPVLPTNFKLPNGTQETPWWADGEFFTDNVQNESGASALPTTLLARDPHFRVSLRFIHNETKLKLVTSNITKAHGLWRKDNDILTSYTGPLGDTTESYYRSDDGCVHQQKGALNLDFEPFAENCPSVVVVTRGLWVVVDNAKSFNINDKADYKERLRAEVNPWLKDTLLTLKKLETSTCAAPIVLVATLGYLIKHPTISDENVQVENEILREAARNLHLPVLDVYTFTAHAGNNGSNVTFRDIHWAEVYSFRQEFRLALADGVRRQRH